MKIVHVITGLKTGGAEMMLAKLLEGMDRSEFAPLVVCLLEPGPIAERIKASGVEVRSLGLRAGIPTPAAFLRLVQILKKEQPQIVQTWLYHADLLGLLAARMAKTGAVAWNLRCSDMDFSQYRKLTGLTVKMNALLSGWPEVVVTNSHRALDVHRRNGYAPRRVEVIPNGFDLERFSPDPACAPAVRAELELDAGTPLVVMAARFDPQKDHKTFFSAASLLLARMPEVRFMLLGDDVADTNPEMVRLVKHEGLQGRVHLLGRRADVPRLLSAADVAVLSSAYGEGFPNVVGEAMACGTPCVVTDVGDSALVVGETGRVVPPRSPNALADAMETLLALPREQRDAEGVAARARVRDRFSLSAITKEYAALYRDLATQRR